MKLKLSKRVFSILLAFALLLSAVSVSFGVFADEAVAQYTVNAATSPAIPVFKGTKVNLDNVDVKFTSDAEAVDGAAITWALASGYSTKEIGQNGNYISAFKNGTYKINATYGDVSKDLYIVVAESGDTAWNIYEIDFSSDYTELYKGLAFEREDTPTAQTTLESTTYNYYTGTWKYNGTAFTTDIPDEIKYPQGWSAYIKGYGSVTEQLTHVMPYDLYGGTQSDNSEIAEAVESRTGIVPFANPWTTDGMHIGAEGIGVKRSNYSLQGLFILNDDVVKAFSDYTITSDYNAYANSSAGYTVPQKISGIAGRITVDENGAPLSADTSTDTVRYTSSYYFSMDNGYAGASGSSTSNTHLEYYGVSINSDWAFVSKNLLSGNHSKVYGTPHGFSAVASEYKGTGTNVSTAIDSIKWDYLEKNGTDVTTGINATSTVGVNVNLSVKYSGNTVTVSSPDDTETFEYAYTGVTQNGAVGIICPGLDTYNSSGNYVTQNQVSFVSVNTFTVSLNNNINGTAGVDYPVYEELDIYTVTSASPAIPMYAETAVDTADFYVELSDGSKVLGSEFTFANASDNANAILIADGKIIANETGVYKLTATRGSADPIEIYAVVAEKDAEAFNLYDIDFNDYTAQYKGLTFEREETPSGESAWVDTDGYYKYYTGTWKYNGQTFTTDIPDEIKYPSGWGAYLKGYNSSSAQLTHVMPYDLYGGTQSENAEITEAIKSRTGIVPFANPWTTDGMHIGTDGFGGSSSNMSLMGIFILNDDAVKAFSDYTITSDYNSYAYNNNSGYTAPQKFSGIAGRITVDESGAPLSANTTTDTVRYTSSYYFDSDGNYKEGGASSANAYLEYFGASINSGWAYVSKNFLGGNHSKVYGTPHGFAAVASTYANKAIDSLKWDYMVDRGTTEVTGITETSTTGVNVNLSVKYAGNTVTVSSPDDTENFEFSYTGVTQKGGAVGIICPSINCYNKSGTFPNSNSWVSVNTFTVSLNNRTEAFGGIQGVDFPEYEDITVIYEDMTDTVATYRGTTNTAPTKAGYVFGGWYSGEGDDYAHTAESLATAITNGEKIYAKFVPASVLKTGWQIPTTTKADDTSTDLRLVSTVDSLNYRNVVFTLTAENINMRMESSTVYSEITGYVDGKGVAYAPTLFSNESYRFMTHKVTGVPNAYFELPITVTANWTTKDGTYVSGEPTVIYIAEALAD